MQRPNEMWIASSLDSNNCLTLKQVVGSFSAPITEEHAWAIVYETCKTLDLCLANPAIFHKLFIADKLEHVYIHDDGLISDRTFIQEPDSVHSHDRSPLVSENKVK